MPHVLILHASLGTGHTSAANALGDGYQLFPDANVSVIDILDYTNDLTRSALQTFYLQVSEKAPSLYKALYEGTESDNPDETLGSEKLLSIFGPPFFNDLQKLIKETTPDIIISTHALAVQVVHHLVERGEYPGLHFVVITDFVAHRTWMAQDVDGYFVPSDLTREILALRGIERERMFVTGIPVNLQIAEPKDLSEIRARLELVNAMPLITLFGGGITAKRVHRMVARLVECVEPFQLVVVAGRNEELENALAELQSGDKVRLQKLGKIDYVDDLIAASDLVITKAGGLIVSEILARSTPMIIIDPIPGQEEWNADFVAGAGAAIQLRMPEMVPAAVEFLLKQKSRLDDMCIQARLVGHPHATLDIVERTLDAWQARPFIEAVFAPDAEAV
jgi:processive 1,2-diacylglycerol beta-glucosyltransferase